MVVLQEPVHDAVQRAGIGNVKLGCFVVALNGGVAADACAGAAAYLGNAAVEELLPHAGALTG